MGSEKHLKSSDDMGNEAGKEIYMRKFQEQFDYPEGFMDQVDNVLWCLKNRPMDRRMMIQLFRPEYIKQSGLPPCLSRTAATSTLP